MKLIYDLNLPELFFKCLEWCEPGNIEPNQIWQGLYSRFGNIGKPRNNLPIFRLLYAPALAENLEFKVLTLATTLNSSMDKTVKSLF